MFSSNTTQVSGAAYEISRSLRFNSADSAYLNRTPASATNRRTFTWSAWVKRGTLSSYTTMFSGAASGSVMEYISFDSNNKLVISSFNGTDYIITTLGVFRDPSAWYHLVVAVDTTQATASNRIKLYVNGVNQTDTSGSYPTQNYDTQINNNVIQYVGTNLYNYWNGYMAEVNFIDGQQLTPSSFGETNADTGIWQPKVYSGSYGTNGFYLNFSDNSNTTAATLGKDYSGNGNNWTPNGFSVSAGVGNDSFVDVPTPYGVDTGVGGTVRGNYCTLNPLDKSTAGGVTRNGNLDYAATTSSWDMIRSTFGISSGKWYWEVSVNSSALGITGIAQSDVVLQNNYFNSGACLGYNAANGQKYSGTGGATAYGASWNASNDICGVAFDADAGTLTFYKNGTSQGVAYTGLSGTYFPAHTLYDTSTATLNFGQRPFAYTAPSGFKALCTQNLPTPTIGATTATQAGKYFAPVTYTGDGTAYRTITTGLQSDFVWIKKRDTGVGHQLFDAVRGAGKVIYSNTTDAEVNQGAYYVQQFNSDNFFLGLTDTAVNGSGATYVSWVWAANGAGSSNTAGTITSQVSVNATSGFSIVTYTGNSTAGATRGHGLNALPKMMFIKGRTGTYGADNWHVYHASLPNTQGLSLQSTAAAVTSEYFWNNTSPTTTVFSTSLGASNNHSGTTYVAYCFAEVAGYSAFGSYTGNGSTDGPFVFTNFQACWLLIKRTDSTQNWFIWDTSRSPSNVMDDTLEPNLSDAENLNDSTLALDVVSNGFKIKTTGSGVNTSSGTYIYMAFAKNPFKYSLAR